MQKEFKNFAYYLSNFPKRKYFTRTTGLFYRIYPKKSSDATKFQVMQKKFRVRDFKGKKKKKMKRISHKLN